MSGRGEPGLQDEDEELLIHGPTLPSDGAAPALQLRRDAPLPERRVPLQETRESQETSLPASEMGGLCQDGPQDTQPHPLADPDPAVLSVPAPALPTPVNSHFLQPH